MPPFRSSVLRNYIIGARFLVKKLFHPDTISSNILIGSSRTLGYCLSSRDVASLFDLFRLVLSLFLLFKMSESPNALTEADNASAILASLSSAPAVEPFQGFNAFYEKVVLENEKRPPNRHLMSRNDLKGFCEHMGVYSISTLFLLTEMEPIGFMNAVITAGEPCECFGSLHLTDRKLFLALVRAHQTAEIGATLPPGGVGMVGTGSASATASETSDTMTAGAPSAVGGKTTAPFSAYDMYRVWRMSMGEKAAAAIAFSKLRAIWRLCNKDRISQYQNGVWMIYDPVSMLSLWNNNLVHASLIGAPDLPACWGSARAFSQVMSMTVFTDIAKLDLFLRMQFVGLDLNSLGIADFHPSGVGMWNVLDAVSNTSGAKVYMRECLHGFITAFTFIFDDVYEIAREAVTSGLAPWSYHAQATPDALVFFNYHAALTAFATTITQVHGTVERPLSGPEHNVKELIQSFEHLTAGKFVSPVNQDFTVFNRTVFFQVKWPRGKLAPGSPGKRKTEVDELSTALTVQPPRKLKKGSTYAERESKRQQAASGGALSVSQAPTTTTNLSLGYCLSSRDVASLFDLFRLVLSLFFPHPPTP